MCQSGLPEGLSGGEGAGLRLRGSLCSFASPNSAPVSESRAGGRGTGSTKPRGYASSQRRRTPKGQRFQRARKALAAISVGDAPAPAAAPGDKVFQGKEGLRPPRQILNTQLQHWCLSVHPCVHRHTRGWVSDAHLGTRALATLKPLPASRRVTCKRGDVEGGERPTSPQGRGWHPGRLMPELSTPSTSKARKGG